MDRKKRILIVDDQQPIHLATKYLLKGKYDFFSAYNIAEAKIQLQNQQIDLVLLDLNIDLPSEGLTRLPELKNIEPNIDYIIVSTNTDVSIATKAIRAGASGYVVKDQSKDQLEITIETTLDKRKLINQNRHHKKNRQRSLDKIPIIGKSSKILDLLKSIEKVQHSSATVIIEGETGVGKELVAQHIAAFSNPFVTVDSATITSSMAESILFGHEKGAFTGALHRSIGLFEEANGGTIYLDEVSNLPLEIQPKLLRAIQEKEIVRLGSTKSIPLSFRIICATNKNLENLSKQGHFKYDLFQRLNVITLQVPSLKERPSDIPLLIEHFLKIHGCATSPKTISKEALNKLMDYRWPGNIRELSNLIANLATMLDGQKTIEVHDLPDHIRKSSDSCPSLEFHTQMKYLEKKFLHSTYQNYGKNISKMSKLLGLSRSHLYSKLHEHNIH